uniref:hypothetical protein n=1 Tax=Agathobacter sp. TaxID=2021311 RepID=UPI004056A32A
MMENFIEYMWYLLHTPLKKLKKSLNKWYVFCKVFGKRLDEAKEDILRARDEGMIATCSHEMLPIHGADRRLTRYEGEHPENFRSRIAMFEVICKLGGTNEGVILAVKSLGFQNVDVALAKYIKNDETRWAEFYVLILLYADDIVPVGYDILRKEVRKTKQVSAKDNYQLAVRVADVAFPYGNRLRDVEKIKNIVFIWSMQRTAALFYTKTEPEGALSVPLKANIWNLEEVHIFKDIVKIGNQISVLIQQKIIIPFHTVNEMKDDFYIEIKNNLWDLDGTYCLDGTQILNAYELKEKL